MRRTIEIREHRAELLVRDAITEAEGISLLRAFRERIDVEFPSPRNGDRWSLTSRGFAGAVALGADATLVVTPKLPVASVARMLQVAYDLPVYTFAGRTASASMPDLYEQLVALLVARVRTILRQGIHHRYRVARRDSTAVRGRVDVRAQLQRPQRLTLPCVFEERTPDVFENRVLLWTLDRILRTGLVGDDLLRNTRSTYRELASVVTCVPVEIGALDAVRYDRMTSRYEEAHRVCRLFLDSAGPVPGRGDTDVIPFLVHMPTLFERCVGRWLASRLPPGFALKTQERRTVGESARVEFIIDLVLYGPDGTVRCVLDTKYKVKEVPAANDVAQVGYYALLTGCRLAGLVYPSSVLAEWHGVSGGVQTFRTTFDLAADVDAAGERLLSYLVPRLERAATSAVES